MPWKSFFGTGKLFPRKYGQRHNEVILWLKVGQKLAYDLDLSKFCPSQVYSLVCQRLDTP